MKITEIILVGLLSCFVPVYCENSNILECWNKILGNDQQSSAVSPTRRKQLLTSKYAKEMVNAIELTNITTSQTKLKEIYTDFKTTSANYAVGNVFAEVINRMLSRTNLLSLSDLIWKVNDEEDDLVLSEINVHLQLELYNRIRELEYHQDKYKFFKTFAYRLRKIKYGNLFNKMDLSLKSKVDNSINSLPYNVKGLYFARNICLSNFKYFNYYIYSLENGGFSLWYKDSDFDDTCYLKPEFYEMGNGEVKIKILNIQNNAYMTGATDANNRKETSTDLWEIIFVDDNRISLFISENYQLCSHERHFLILGQFDYTITECQWFVQPCNLNNL